MIKSLALLFAGVFGAGGIAARAFETHSLAALPDMFPARMTDFSSGTQMLLLHAVALLALSCRPSLISTWLAASALALGTIFFSGPLLTFGLTGDRGLIMLVPIGGTLLIAGWVVLAVCGAISLFRKPEEPH